MKLIWFSEIKWDYLHTRKQQLLSRLPEDWEILFLETYRKGVKNNWIVKQSGNVKYLTTPQLKNIPNDTIIRWFFDKSMIRFIFNVFAIIWTYFAIRLNGFRKADVFFISNVNSVNVAKRLCGKHPLIYDCNDDHTAFPNTAKWTKDYFDKLCQTADQVIVSAESLRKKVQNHGAQIIVRIDNGVDFDRFQVKPDKPPKDLALIPAPRIGYIGAIDRWFDIELWNRLSDYYTNYSFILLGPINPAIDSEIKLHSNIYKLGVKDYYDLPNYLHFCDLTIIPFKQNDLTKHVNPNKLYEYFACGKTVVSTSFSEHLLEEKDNLYIAESYDKFIELVQTAMENPVDSNILKHIAKNKSWDKSATQLVKVVNETIKEKHNESNI